MKDLHSFSFFILENYVRNWICILQKVIEKKTWQCADKSELRKLCQTYHATAVIHFTIPFPFNLIIVYQIFTRLFCVFLIPRTIYRLIDWKLIFSNFFLIPRSIDKFTFMVIFLFACFYKMMFWNYSGRGGCHMYYYLKVAPSVKGVC